MPTLHVKGRAFSLTQLFFGLPPVPAPPPPGDNILKMDDSINPDGQPYGDYLEYDTGINDYYVAVDVYLPQSVLDAIDPFDTATLITVGDDGIYGSVRDGVFYTYYSNSGDAGPIIADEWVTVEVHLVFVPGTGTFTTTWRVNGTVVDTNTDNGFGPDNDSWQRILIGGYPGGNPGVAWYWDNFIVATGGWATESGTEIFSENFDDSTIDGFTQFGEYIYIIANPF